MKCFRHSWKYVVLVVILVSSFGHILGGQVLGQGKQLELGRPDIRLLSMEETAFIRASGCDCEKSVPNGCPPCVETEECPETGYTVVWCFADGTKCGAGGTQNCGDSTDGPCKITETFSEPGCGGVSVMNHSGTNRKVNSLTACT